MGSNRCTVRSENIVVVKDDRCRNHDRLVGAAAGLIADGGFIGMTYLVGFGPLIIVGGLEFNGSNVYHAEEGEFLGEGHIGTHCVAYCVCVSASRAVGGTETGDANIFIIVQQVFKIGAGQQDGHDFGVGKEVFLACVAHDQAVIGVGVGGGQHHPAKGVGIAITIRVDETRTTATCAVALNAINLIPIALGTVNGSKDLLLALEIAVEIADNGLASYGIVIHVLIIYIKDLIERSALSRIYKDLTRDVKIGSSASSVHSRCANGRKAVSGVYCTIRGLEAASMEHCFSEVGQAAVPILHHDELIFGNQNQLVLVVVVEVSDGGNGSPYGFALLIESLGDLQIPDCIPRPVVFFVENQKGGYAIKIVAG